MSRHGTEPVSPYYLSHKLDAAGTTVRALRSSRLARLVTTTDPVLVAQAFGLHPRASTYYLADSVDAPRLPG